VTLPLEELGRTYACDGATTQFDIPFTFDDPSYVKVTRTIAAGGEAVLGYGADFSVVTVEGRPVFATFAAYPDGDELTVDRDTPPIQGAAFTSDDITPTVLNRALDKLTRGWAEMKRALARTVRLPAAWSGAALVIPTPSPLRAIGWNQSGTGLVNLDVTTGDLALAQPFATAAQLGLTGNGVTDDSPAFEAACLLYEAGQLPSVWFLQAPGGAFRFDGQCRIRSGLTVIFASPQKYGAAGNMMIAGEMAYEEGATARLLAAVSVAGDTLPIDMSLAGGGAVSSIYPVGSRLTVLGSPDSAGTPTQRDEVAVTAVDDDAGTVTVDPPVTSAFPAAATVSLQVTGYLASDAAEEDNAVELVSGAGAKFEPGDVVILEDDLTQADLGAIGDTGRLRRQVLGVDDVTGDTVRFDRTVEWDFLTSRGARLTLLDPVVGASVQGLSAEFVEDPASHVRSFEGRYAVRCTVYDPAVENEDDFGRWGDAVRFLLSIDCAVYTPIVRNPKFTDAGQGYGAVFDHCSDCLVYQGLYEACRHSVLFYNSARCVALQPASNGALVTDVDFHGGAERSCVALQPKIIGGSRTATTSRAAISFGSSTAYGGSKGCRVVGGSVTHYRGDNAPIVHQAFGVVWQPGTEDCRVLGTRMADVEQPFQIIDIAAQPSLVAKDPYAEVDIDGAVSYLGWFKGNHNNPAAGYTIQGLQLKVRARNVSKLFRLERIKGASLQLDLDEVTPDGGEPYVFRAVDVPSLALTESSIVGAARGFSVQNCTPADAANGRPFLIDRTRLVALTVGEVLDDLGGNDGGVWGDVECVGFDPTIGGTLASKLHFRRSAGGYSVADDAARVFKPARTRGRVVLSWDGGGLIASYKVGASPASAKLGGISATAATTGALAGTTGTDGNVTVSAHTDGLLYVENRSGGTITLAAEML
jgi:hypothetical protein